MAGFRGIGDTATQVKLQQDQQAIAASSAAASRAESARQADASRAQRADEFAQGMEAQKENTAWTRSQAEQNKAEEARRFGIGQEMAGRQEQRAERQLTLQEFGNKLAEQRFAQETVKNDIQTQASKAQLAQYLAATAEENQAKANRERIAQGSFGSMVIAAKLNGGVIPQRALEIGNKELGDPNAIITGGGFDENTGIAFWNIMNKQDGSTKTLRMTPENQYSAIRHGIGKEEADMFYDTYKVGSAARAAIDRRRIELQESIAVDEAKQINRRALDANDPLKKSEDLLKKAETFNKLAGDMTNTSITQEQRDEYRQTASDFAKEADRLLKGTLPQKSTPKPFAVTPEMQNKYGIPPTNRVVPNPQGGVSVFWRDKDGKPNKQDFAPGEW